jgi:hypothetical protein
MPRRKKKWMLLRGKFGKFILNQMKKYGLNLDNIFTLKDWTKLCSATQKSVMDFYHFIEKIMDCKQNP